MATAVLLLGTNLGDKNTNLIAAINLLNTCSGRVIRRSPVFVTPPWGFSSPNEFYNQALTLETTLPPFDLLNTLQSVEKNMGRQQKTGPSGYHDRLIDIDILFYNDLVMESQRLTIPHPHLHKRRFTLAPLAVLLPDFVHPLLQKNIATLLARCPDNSEVLPLH